MMEIKGKDSDHQWGIIYGVNGVAPPLMVSDMKEAVKIMVDERKYPCDNKEGYIMVKEGDGVVTGRPYACGKSAQSQQSPTIITAKGGGSGVVVAGNLTDSNVVQDKQVYGENGVSPSVITPGGSGSKIKIECTGDVLVSEEIADKGFMSRNVYDVEGVAPSLRSSQGMGSRDKIMWPNGANGAKENPMR